METETVSVKTVLFDLDGTLADTAPDLAYALNTVLQEQGKPALAFEQIRPIVSHGGIALIRFGFGIDTDDPQFDALRNRLLDIYKDNLTRETTVFPGMDAVLDEIEQRGMKWGVVTNKPAWLTDPLMTQLNLSRRAACIVSGDTTNNRKPHPFPLLHACEIAGSTAAECLYVGDAQRDIEAGVSAKMRTLVALFGYIGEQDAPESWGADDMVTTPWEILEWIDNNQ